MDYHFEPYDVLQIFRNGGWTDFATLRSEQDEMMARRLVIVKVWESQAVDFRIVRGGRKQVVFANPMPR